MRVRIVPAIIPESLDDLKEHLSTVVGTAPVVQIDVCDGVFVPRKSWPYSNPKSFEPIVNQNEGLPFWEDFDFEFDLMVSNPVTEAEKYILAGASSVIIHLDSVVENGETVVDEVQALRERVQVKCALSVTSNIDDIEKYLGEVDGIQCMGIARIGFQGESFDDRSLTQIKGAHQKFQMIPIGIDGGVTNENLNEIIEAGATDIAVGSHIFNSPIPSERYKDMLSQANDMSDDIMSA